MLIWHFQDFSDHLIEEKSLILADVSHDLEKLFGWDLLDHLPLLIQNLRHKTVCGLVDMDPGSSPLVERFRGGNVCKWPCRFSARLRTHASIVLRVLAY
jgi:hypothetical protein